MKKDWRYKVTLHFTGTFEDVNKGDCIELIKNDIVSEVGIRPMDKEIEIWEDK